MVDRWRDTLEIDERILTEIIRFDEAEGGSGDGFGNDFASGLATDIRRLVFDTVAERLEALSRGQCTPFVEVTYPEPGFASRDGEAPAEKRERKFEAGFIRTEVLACLECEGVSPEGVLRAYTDPEFRKRVSSRIERIWMDGDDSCIETKGFRPFLSSTLACNRIDEFHAPRIASQHSQVVSNPGGKDYQDVYFKESLKTFVVIPGGMALHYINYTRTVKLGGLRKSIGRKKVIGSQEDAVEALQRMLRGGEGD